MKCEQKRKRAREWTIFSIRERENAKFYWKKKHFIFCHTCSVSIKRYRPQYATMHHHYLRRQKQKTEANSKIHFDSNSFRKWFLERLYHIFFYTFYIENQILCHITPSDVSGVKTAFEWHKVICAPQFHSSCLKIQTIKIDRNINNLLLFSHYIVFF